MQNRYVSHIIPDVLLGLLVLVVVVLPAKPPTVTFGESILWPNSPIRVYFSEPLQISEAKKEFTLYDGDKQIPLRVENAASGVVLFPLVPLRSNISYEISVASLPAVSGGEMTLPKRWLFRVLEERLVAIDNQGRLFMIDSTSSEPRFLTDTTVHVTDFSVGREGKFVGVYHPTDATDSSGFFLGSVDDQGHVHIDLLPQLNLQRYSSIHFCDQNSMVVLAHFENDGTAKLSVLAVNWDAKNEKMLEPRFSLPDTGVYGAGDIACSVDTARIVFRRSDGMFVSTFLGETDMDMLGRYRETNGFVANDTFLAMTGVATDTAGLPMTQIDLLSNVQGRNWTEEGWWVSGLSIAHSAKAAATLLTNALTFDTELVLYDFSGVESKRVATLVPSTNQYLDRVLIRSDGSGGVVEITSSADPIACLAVFTPDKIEECSWQGRRPAWLR